MAEDNFVDDGNHALLTGIVAGALQKAGLPAMPAVDDDGDYLPYIIVERPSGKWKISVDPME